MTEEWHKKLADLAVRTATIIKEDSHNLICNGQWLVFALLYQEMVTRKEINNLSEIGKDKALMYWTEACVSRPEATKFKRICITQALYMYDLISERF